MVGGCETWQRWFGRCGGKMVMGQEDTREEDAKKQKQIRTEDELMNTGANEKKGNRKCRHLGVMAEGGKK